MAAESAAMQEEIGRIQGGVPNEGTFVGANNEKPVVEFFHQQAGTREFPNEASEGGAILVMASVWYLSNPSHKFKFLVKDADGRVNTQKLTDLGLWGEYKDFEAGVPQEVMGTPLTEVEGLTLDTMQYLTEICNISSVEQLAQCQANHLKGIGPEKSNALILAANALLARQNAAKEVESRRDEARRQTAQLPAALQRLKEAEAKIQKLEDDLEASRLREGASPDGSALAGTQYMQPPAAAVAGPSVTHEMLGDVDPPAGGAGQPVPPAPQGA